MAVRSDSSRSRCVTFYRITPHRRRRRLIQRAWATILRLNQRPAGALPSYPRQVRLMPSPRSVARGHACAACAPPACAAAVPGHAPTNAKWERSGWKNSRCEMSCIQRMRVRWTLPVTADAGRRGSGQNRSEVKDSESRKNINCCSVPNGAGRTQVASCCAAQASKRRHVAACSRQCRPAWCFSARRALDGRRLAAPASPSRRSSAGWRQGGPAMPCSRDSLGAHGQPCRAGSSEPVRAARAILCGAAQVRPS
jgi:hypothetical protein